MRLPATVSANVDLRSSSGRVESAFEGLESSRKPGAAGLAGTLGTGDGRLSVSTVSGAVTLLRRNPPAGQERSRVGTEEAR